MSIEAMKQALEALKKSHPYSNMDKDLNKHSEAITSLRQAIEQAEQAQPVVEHAPCQGMNCGITRTDQEHSMECQAEHAAAIAGGVFVKAEQVQSRSDAQPVAAWTEAQHERAYRNSPELHKDVKSLAAFKRVAKEIAAMYGIKGEAA